MTFEQTSSICVLLCVGIIIIVIMVIIKKVKPIEKAKVKVPTMHPEPFKLYWPEQAHKIFYDGPALEEEITKAYRETQLKLDWFKHNEYQPYATLSLRLKVAKELCKILKESDSKVQTQLCKWGPFSNFNEINRQEMCQVIIAYDLSTLKKGMKHATEW